MGGGGVDARKNMTGGRRIPCGRSWLFDRLVDQRRTMLESGIPWSLVDGEVETALTR
jgi:hypothetical protein